MDDTKFINHNGQSRKPRLHIEGDGMVVNIINGLLNHDYNAKTTAIAISADQYSGEEWFLLGDSDTPLKYINVRVIQGKLPETKVYANGSANNRVWYVERGGKPIATFGWQDFGHSEYNWFLKYRNDGEDKREIVMWGQRTSQRKGVDIHDFTKVNAEADALILERYGLTELSAREERHR